MLGLHRCGRRQTVTKAETKTCPLCSGLNYHTNAQCLVCGWRGGFENDAAVTDYHWHRLTERYEEVRLEHLVPRKTTSVGHFGVTRRATFLQQFWLTCSAGWQSLRVSAGRGAASPRKGNTVGQSAGPSGS